MLPLPLLIRNSSTADLPAMRDTYADAVTLGTSSFELEAPDCAEMSRRRDELLARGLPWLVAGRGAKLLGYAFVAPFRPLLAELIARCEAVGMRQMLAVIGDSANKASIRMHRALGFEDCGQLNSVGWKFGRWLDVGLMQRRLGPWASRAASADAP